MNDVLYGFVGLVVSGFQSTVGPICGIGLVMEATVRQRTTEAFVEEQEQECDLDAFRVSCKGSRYSMPIFLH